MGKQLEVAICGDSLLAAGIGASLEAQAGIRVSRLGRSLAEAAPELRMLSPHAVIFEMTRDELAAIGGVLREGLGLTLIGLDREQDAVTVFSAGRQAIKSGEELAKVIAARTNEERD
jgi:hypothetical protein